MPKRTSDDDGLELPPFVEGVLGFFEGFNKKAVHFFWVEGNEAHACMYCARGTDLRLQAKRETEVLTATICHDCKDMIREAPVA